MSKLSLAITFNGSFRIGSGRSGVMLDDVLDPDRLLPGTSLKGVMREAARALFPMVDDATDHPMVAEVFGTTRSRSPWHWDDAEFAVEPSIRPKARIALDDRRRTEPGALFVVEAAHTSTATATIWQQDQIEREIRRERRQLPAQPTPKPAAPAAPNPPSPAARMAAQLTAQPTARAPAGS